MDEACGRVQIRRGVEPPLVGRKPEDLQRVVGCVLQLERLRKVRIESSRMLRGLAALEDGEGEPERHDPLQALVAPARPQPHQPECRR
tara:strand:- start:215 stop:478 length:264 start_codon:yes stop_codon:yes gene_type:complete